MKRETDKSDLRPLLKIRETYGFRIGVDPDVVLAGFLTELWTPPDNNQRLKILTEYLCDKKNKNCDILSSRIKYKYKNNEILFKQYLREKLWLKPQITIDYLRNNKVFDDSQTDIKRIYYNKVIYRPLNKYFLKKVLPLEELGSILCNGLKNSITNTMFNSIKEKIDILHDKEEVEEKIIKILMPYEKYLSKQGLNPDDSISPPELTKYKDLFMQLASDIDSLLSIDINSIAKPKLLNFLKKLVNFYATQYYLSVISEIEGNDRPLITPLCGDNSNSKGQEVSSNCLSEYRQKAIRFWRNYIKENVKINIKLLSLENVKLDEILDTFLKDENREIFGHLTTLTPKTLETIRKKIRKEINETASMYKESSLTDVELLVEGFLQYNLRSSRTIAKIRILDHQGPGAGIVAPKGKKWKHFHLNIELLELLVICFIYSTDKKYEENTLRNFILFLEVKYGMVIDDNNEIRRKLEKQNLPVPYFSQKGKLEQMLDQLNMLITLSDTTKKLKCSYTIKRNL